MNPQIVAFVRELVEPLMDRLEELERRDATHRSTLADMQKGMSDMLSGIQVDLAKAQAAASEAHARNLADIMARAERLERELTESLRAVDGAVSHALSLKDGKDGRDGIDGKDGAPGLEGPPGKDGRDGIDGKDGAPGKDGRDGIDGAPGKDGADGRDGKDVDMDAVLRDLQAFKAEAQDELHTFAVDLRNEAMDHVRSLEPREGPPGPAGRDGIDGKDGRDGIDGKDGADGRDGLPGVPGRDGKDGVDGKDGAPGLDGRDGAPGLQGPPGKSWTLRGTYTPGMPYESLDIAFKDGNGWLCLVDAPAAGPGEDNPDEWRMALKRGDRGKAGPAGPDGRGIQSMAIDGKTLLVLYTDGSTERLPLDFLDPDEGGAP